MRAERIVEQIVRRPVDVGRYRQLLTTLQGLPGLVRGRHVLDFGCGDGTSAVALLEAGAARVTGVDPDIERVERGRPVLAEAGLLDRCELLQVADTRRLPFEARRFDAVLANGVFEHIPQPRDAYVRECWRVLGPGGHLIVRETPNKYLPYDSHTTGLWWVPWLPRELARSYAVWRGRSAAGGNWNQSGWRGCGYFELARAIPGEFERVPELGRLRHRVLQRVGLPSNLFDPAPLWIWRRPA